MMAYAGDLTQSMNALSMEDECPEARERRLIAELLAENQILRHGLAEQYGRIIITREQLNQANFSRETILDCIKYLSQRMLGLIEEVHNHGESLATKRSLRICSTNLETFVKFLPHSVSQWNIA